MIVVVIVGILAALAIVGYRRLVTSSHVSEATNMVQNIRVAQEGYHSETQQYAGLSAKMGPTNTQWYPNTSPTGRIASSWGAKCNVCQTGMDWSMLPVHVDGPVIFGYATTAGPPGVAPADTSIAVNGQTISAPSSPVSDWYMIGATSDLDGNGAPNTYVFTSSWSNQVFVDSEGQ
jgi:type IV pilus assembly protein PilA